MGLPEFMNLVGNAGLMVALVCFFVWQNTKEKAALSERINGLEDFNRGKMSSMVEETTVALTNSTRAVEDNSKVMSKLYTKLEQVKLS